MGKFSADFLELVPPDGVTVQTVVRFLESLENLLLLKNEGLAPNTELVQDYTDFLHSRPSWAPKNILNQILELLLKLQAISGSLSLAAVGGGAFYFEKLLPPKLRFPNCSGQPWEKFQQVCFDYTRVLYFLSDCRAFPGKIVPRFTPDVFLGGILYQNAQDVSFGRLMAVDLVIRLVRQGVSIRYLMEYFFNPIIKMVGSSVDEPSVDQPSKLSKLVHIFNPPTLYAFHELKSIGYLSEIQESRLARILQYLEFCGLFFKLSQDRRRIRTWIEPLLPNFFTALPDARELLSDEQLECVRENFIGRLSNVLGGHFNRQFESDESQEALKKFCESRVSVFMGLSQLLFYVPKSQRDSLLSAVLRAFFLACKVFSNSQGQSPVGDTKKSLALAGLILDQMMDFVPMNFLPSEEDQPKPADTLFDAFSRGEEQCSNFFCILNAEDGSSQPTYQRFCPELLAYLGCLYVVVSGCKGDAAILQKVSRWFPRELIQSVLKELDGNSPEYQALFSMRDKLIALLCRSSDRAIVRRDSVFAACASSGGASSAVDVTQLPLGPMTQMGGELSPR